MSRGSPCVLCFVFLLCVPAEDDKRKKSSIVNYCCVHRVAFKPVLDGVAKVRVAAVRLARTHPPPILPPATCTSSSSETNVWLLALRVFPYPAFVTGATC